MSYWFLLRSLRQIDNAAVLVQKYYGAAAIVNYPLTT